MSLFKRADKKRKKEMATGFRWGKREHHFEALMTKCLWINLLLVVVYTSLVYKDGIEAKDYILGGICAIAIVTLIFRVLTEFCHRMEKRNMDPHRFGHKKKSIFKVLFKW